MPNQDATGTRFLIFGFILGTNLKPHDHFRASSNGADQAESERVRRHSVGRRAPSDEPTRQGGQMTAVAWAAPDVAPAQTTQPVEGARQSLA